MKSRVCEICKGVIPSESITNNRQKTHRGECRRRHALVKMNERNHETYPNRRWPLVKKRVESLGLDTSLKCNGETCPSADIQRLIIDGLAHRSRRETKRASRYRMEQLPLIQAHEEYVQEHSIKVTLDTFRPFIKKLERLAFEYAKGHFRNTNLSELIRLIDVPTEDTRDPRMLLIALGASSQWDRYLRPNYSRTFPRPKHHLTEMEQRFWENPNRNFGTTVFKTQVFTGNSIHDRLPYWKVVQAITGKKYTGNDKITRAGQRSAYTEKTREWTRRRTERLKGDGEWDIDDDGEWNLKERATLEKDAKYVVPPRHPPGWRPKKLPSTIRTQG